MAEEAGLRSQAGTGTEVCLIPTPVAWYLLPLEYELSLAHIPSSLPWLWLDAQWPVRTLLRLVAGPSARKCVATAVTAFTDVGLHVRPQI